MLAVTRNGGFHFLSFHGHHIKAHHTVTIDLRVEPEIHLGAGNRTLGDILHREGEDQPAARTKAQG